MVYVLLRLVRVCKWLVEVLKACWRLCEKLTVVERWRNKPIGGESALYSGRYGEAMTFGNWQSQRVSKGSGVSRGRVRVFYTSGGEV